MLEFLRTQEIELFVWTARPCRSAQEILKNLEIGHFFKSICGMNDAPGKPSPEGLRYLLPGIAAENVIVIGDSMGDIIGANAFGAHAIAALWGRSGLQETDAYVKHGAKAIFTDVEKCRVYLSSLII